MMDSHHLALEMEKRNESIRKAFGIREDYVGGSAFDFLEQQAKAAERKAKREEEEEEREKQKIERAAAEAKWVVGVVCWGSDTLVWWFRLREKEMKKRKKKEVEVSSSSDDDR